MLLLLFGAFSSVGSIIFDLVHFKSVVDVLLLVVKIVDRIFASLGNFKLKNKKVNLKSYAY